MRWGEVKGLVVVVAADAVAAQAEEVVADRGGWVAVSLPGRVAAAFVLVADIGNRTWRVSRVIGKSAQSVARR